jgi:hypothetical protein
MAKKKPVRKRSPHAPSKVFALRMRKEVVDHLIKVLENVDLNKIGHDEEDDWVRTSTKELNQEALELLRRTDLP